MKQFDGNSESEKLRALLNSITQELDSSFLERRGMHKSHKLNALDELNDAIIEINNREKDLQAAAGIALMLLDKSEKLNLKVYKYKNKLLQANENYYKLSIEFKTSQESLKAAERKNEELKQTLIETEESMLLHSNELNKIMTEKFVKDLDKISKTEVEQIQNSFVAEIDELYKKIRDLEKKDKKHLEYEEKLKNEQKNMNNEYILSVSQHQNTSEKLKETEKKLKDLELKHEQLMNSKNLLEID